MGLQDIKGYLIGILLGIVIITSGIFMFGKLNLADPTLDSGNDLDDFNRTLDLSANITTAVNQINPVMENKSGLFGWIDTIVHSTTNSVILLKDSTKFVGVAAEETSNMFSLTELNPIIVLITLIIVIIIGIAVYETIIRV